MLLVKTKWHVVQVRKRKLGAYFNAWIALAEARGIRCNL
jgi:hypothetical protein